MVPDLPTTPLVNRHDWRVRGWVVGVLLLVVTGLVVKSGQAGVPTVVFILVVLWFVIVGPSWARSRAGLRVDGDVLRVSRAFGETVVSGGDVAQVRYVYNGRSPDLRLVLRNGRRVLVKASDLERGHSVVFEWVRRCAPGVTYDRKAAEVRDRLVAQDLVGRDPDVAGTAEPA